MKIVEWVSYDSEYDDNPYIGGIGGFFQKGMRWKDYWNEEAPTEWKNYVSALRDNIVQTGTKTTGEHHQYNECGSPLFEDNTVGRFSYRAWGDLMAAIWSEEEDKDYCYMDFYM